MSDELAQTPPTGVLIMAYGSPESVEELPAYLLDIRGGRPTSPELVEEITGRYRLIGGRSPLLDLTRRQAAALEAELNRRYPAAQPQFRLYVGMRHWQPRISQAVAQMAADGVQRAVALVMAPHSSRLSTGAYFSKLDEALAGLGAEIQFCRIESWHAEPGLIEAIAERARLAWQRFGGLQPYVLFTAHSLPQRILAQGDPYDTQLRETAALLSARLGLQPGRWQFCYQSAGQSAEPWLGPPVEQVVAQLAGSGDKNILVVPVGFVCDHVEVLYDIDIACREIAAARGARLERSDSLNDSPLLISLLADLVARRLEIQPG